ncbi:hypothetical protein PCAR4_1220018 [Paraburkholderia caribensis]|nr:hypothetical protein PCAR4_1220018 [Paraburkholderia caribensis]
MGCIQPISAARIDYKPEIYKDYFAPIFRRGGDAFETVPASFGIVPRRHIPPGVKVFDTMNARSESVEQKRSFSSAWKNLQLCLIPCRTFFEPNYETGNAVRWKIGMADGEPLAIRRVMAPMEGGGRFAVDRLHDANRQLRRAPAYESLPQTRRRKAVGRDRAGDAVRRLVVEQVDRRCSILPATLSGGRDARGAIPSASTEAEDAHQR